MSSTSAISISGLRVGEDDTEITFEEGESSFRGDPARRETDESPLPRDEATPAPLVTGKGGELR